MENETKVGKGEERKAGNPTACLDSECSNVVCFNMWKYQGTYEKNNHLNVCD